MNTPQMIHELCEKIHRAQEIFIGRGYHIQHT